MGAFATDGAVARAKKNRGRAPVSMAGKAFNAPARFRVQPVHHQIDWSFSRFDVPKDELLRVKSKLLGEPKLTRETTFAKLAE
jgi:hypothetical protein